MKNFIIFFFFGLININSLSQEKTTGLVLNINKNPIANANVVIKNEQGKILAFTFSNSKGAFEITYDTKASILFLEISHISYNPEKLQLVKAENLQIFLENRTEALPTVIVKNNNTIRQQKDTVNYAIDSFKNGKDRVLKDVLEKLPGITINTNGQILYQNKPINKFYIDGSDILDDRYSIASNNMPIDVIDKVQVLENHQPIKMLDSLVFSDRAGLNIKLKKNTALKLIGRGVCNYGYNPNVLQNNQFSIFELQGKVKFILNLKTNNIGNELESESVALNSTTLFDVIKSKSIFQQFVQVSQVSKPNAKLNRFNFNADNLITNNLQFKLKKDKQVKVFIGFLANKNVTNLDTHTKIYLPNDTIKIMEKTNNYSKSKKYFTTITFTKNSNSIYYNNILNASIINTQEQTAITNVNNQKLNTPFVNANNYLQIFKKIGNKFIQFNSFSAYTNTNQKLEIEAGVFSKLINNNVSYKATKQQIQLHNFYTNNFASFNNSIGKFGLQNKIGISLERQTINTDLFKKIGNSFESLSSQFINRNNWNRYIAYAETKLSKSTQTVNYSFGVSLNNHFASFDTIGSFTKNKLFRQFINSSIDLWKKFGRHFTTSITLNHSNNLGTIENTRNGFFLENYRTLIQTNSIPLNYVQSCNISKTVNYKNILKSIFITSTISVDQSKENFINNAIFENSFQKRIAIPYENKRLTKLWRIAISKYYNAIKTNLQVQINYQNVLYYAMLQNTINKYKNAIYSNKIKVNTTLNNKYIISYESNFTFNNTKLIQLGNYYPFSKFNSIKQNLNFDKSFNDFFAGISVEHNFNTSPKKVSNFFVDLNLLKKLKRSKIDLTLQFLNVLNTNSIVNNVLYDVTFISSESFLRPFSIMCGVKFTF